ncbi:hypothetical protein GQ53DRAFT_834099 [Thozetella sp. PMI_491]|nr:hypothetical protein GQ53DRAFT_834099 [Thozetella sp. PMI_491]
MPPTRETRSTRDAALSAPGAPEGSWPGDRNPSANDAADAYSPLELDSLPAFRQAVLAESQSRRQHLMPEAMNGTIDHALSQAKLIEPVRQTIVPNQVFSAVANFLLRAQLFWPAGLFSTSHAPGPVEQLVNKCAEGFLARTPFLQDIPISLFVRSPRPQYLTLAMASIGSLLLKEPVDVSSSYWHDSIRLMTGKLEVDNREARSLDLIKAWVLLETYAVLSSDMLVWKRASLAHGYVETAVSRLLRQFTYTDQSHQHEQDLAAQYSRSLLAYFRLVDLLRAIHYGEPATFAGSDPKFLLPQRDKDASISNHQPAEQVQRDAIIKLTTIFAHVHSLKVSLGATTAESSSTTPTFTSHIPFSFATELLQCEKRYLSELESWRQTYMENVSEETRLLYLFSNMYLAVPDIPSLFASAKYEPWMNGTPRAYCKKRHASVPTEQTKDAIALAWQVLDTCESLPTDSLPIWSSMAVFTAALVVSANFGSSASVEGKISANSRLLKSFELEMARMNAPCTADLIQALRRLRGL